MNGVYINKQLHTIWQSPIKYFVEVLSVVGFSIEVGFRIEVYKVLITFLFNIATWFILVFRTTQFQHCWIHNSAVITS